MRSHTAVHCACVCAALARFSSCNLGAHLPAKRALITIPKPHMRMPPRPHDAHADGSAATRGLCAPGCAAARNQVVRAWAGAYARAATGLVDALRLAMRKRIAKDAQHQHQHQHRQGAVGTGDGDGGGGGGLVPPTLRRDVSSSSLEAESGDGSVAGTSSPRVMVYVVLPRSTDGHPATDRLTGRNRCRGCLRIGAYGGGGGGGGGRNSSTCGCGASTSEPRYARRTNVERLAMRAAILQAVSSLYVSEDVVSSVRLVAENELLAMGYARLTTGAVGGAPMPATAEDVVRGPGLLGPGLPAMAVARRMVFSVFASLRPRLLHWRLPPSAADPTHAGLFGGGLSPMSGTGTFVAASAGDQATERPPDTGGSRMLSLLDAAPAVAADDSVRRADEQSAADTAQSLRGAATRIYGQQHARDCGGTTNGSHAAGCSALSRDAGTHATRPAKVALTWHDGDVDVLGRAQPVPAAARPPAMPVLTQPPFVLAHSAPLPPQLEQFFTAEQASGASHAAAAAAGTTDGAGAAAAKGSVDRRVLHLAYVVTPDDRSLAVGVSDARGELAHVHVVPLPGVAMQPTPAGLDRADGSGSGNGNGNGNGSGSGNGNGNGGGSMAGQGRRGSTAAAANGVSAGVSASTSRDARERRAAATVAVAAWQVALARVLDVARQLAARVAAAEPDNAIQWCVAACKVGAMTSVEVDAWSQVLVQEEQRAMADGSGHPPVSFHVVVYSLHCAWAAHCSYKPSRDNHAAPSGTGNGTTHGHGHNHGHGHGHGSVSVVDAAAATRPGLLSVCEGRRWIPPPHSTLFIQPGMHQPLASLAVVDSAYPPGASLASTPGAVADGAARLVGVLQSSQVPAMLGGSRCFSKRGIVKEGSHAATPRRRAVSGGVVNMGAGLMAAHPLGTATILMPSTCPVTPNATPQWITLQVRECAHVCDAGLCAIAKASCMCAWLLFGVLAILRRRWCGVSAVEASAQRTSLTPHQ